MLVLKKFKKVPPCNAEVLKRGRTHTVQLSSHMLGGRDSWLRWHQRFAEALSPQLEQARPIACASSQSHPMLAGRPCYADGI